MILIWTLELQKALEMDNWDTQEKIVKGIKWELKELLEDLTSSDIKFDGETLLQIVKGKWGSESFEGYAASEKWHNILSEWCQQCQFWEKQKLYIKGMLIKYVQFNFTRFEGKRYITLCLEAPRRNAINSKLDTLGLLQKYQEGLYEFLENKKDALEISDYDYVKQALHSGAEWYSVANPLLVLSKREKYGIKEKGFDSMEMQSFTLYSRDAYVVQGSKAQIKEAQGEKEKLAYTKCRYNFVSTNENPLEVAKATINDIAHSQRITLARINSYVEENVIETERSTILERIIDVLIVLWINLLPELTILNKISILNPYRHLIYALMELNFAASVVKCDVCSKINKRIDIYEDKFKRILLTFEHIDKEKMGKYYQEYLGQCSYPLKRDKQNVGTIERKLMEITDYSGRLRDNTNIYENFSIQLLMMLFSVIVFVWGIASIAYDKMYFSDQMVAEIFLLTTVPCNLVKVTVVIIGICLFLSSGLFRYFGQKYSGKTRKRGKQCLIMESKWDLQKESEALKKAESIEARIENMKKDKTTFFMRFRRSREWLKIAEELLMLMLEISNVNANGKGGSNVQK